MEKINYNIEIGDKFYKKLSKGKTAIAEVVDIVERISTKTGNLISKEYWAKSENFNFGKSFEVAKTTIALNRIKN